MQFDAGPEGVLLTCIRLTVPVAPVPLSPLSSGRLRWGVFGD